jgi:hypothetical protein
MSPVTVEQAKRQLIDVLRAESAHILAVAAALEKVEAPEAVLSALDPLGKTQLCGKMNALSGALGVLALLARDGQAQQQDRR